jgi:phage shock protein C
MEPKKLYRSRTNRVFAGVCGGLGEYFSVDATMLRLIWILVVVFTGLVPGVLVYIIAIFVIPPEPLATSQTQSHTQAQSTNTTHTV